MSNRFQQKVAIVTGAASGIGAATARRLAHDGARVVIADINLEGGRAVAQEISARGGTVLAVRADITDEGSVRELVDATVTAFGGIDLLVNNAYFGSTGDGSVVSTPPQEWERVYGVNVMGCARCCRLVIPRLIERGGGAIVNLASLAALTAEKQRSAYGSSKAAVIAMTRSLAVQFGRQGIRANAIAPGLIGTENVLKNLAGIEQFVKDVSSRTPLGRIGRPEEIAAAICFLLSDDASYVTGQTLFVEGGLTASGGSSLDGQGPV
jgi:NAD(P)-dependent dehydrogenase (short-subunit alcohol dehydrogenase family)